MIADRVQETTATTGTSTYVLGGAPVGRRTFVQAFGTGKTVTYLAEDSTGVNWELGRGVITAAGPDTLTRATIIRSSNSNNAVSWNSGTKNVICVANADLVKFGLNCEIPTAAGTAQALTLAYNPSLTDLLDGQIFEFKVSASTNTGINPTLNIDSTGAKTIVDRDGGAIYPGHLIASSILLVIYESTGDRFRIVGMAGSWRKRLTGNMNFYVNGSSGSDTTGTGLDTGASAWATLQKAITYIQQNVDLNGFVATVNVANGTYTGGVYAAGPVVGMGLTGSGRIRLLGDTTTPANVIISVTSADCVKAERGAFIAIAGFEFRTTTGGRCLVANDQATILIDGACRFGACAFEHAYAYNYGLILIAANYTVSGSAISHWLAMGGRIVCVNLTVTTSGTPAFSGAWAWCGEHGSIICYGITFSGTGATGTRYTVYQNSLINTNGGGASYLPGSVGGSAATGGQYV